MPDIRTIVTFQASAFNTTERKDYFINDGCYGDDVARWLMQQLRARGVQTDTSPGQEDFGWYFGLRIRDTNYHFVVGYRPAAGDDPAVWIGWLERQAGLLSSILGARKRGIDPEAVRALHTALSSSRHVSDMRWHLKEDFDRGKEEDGKTDPTMP